MTLIRNVCSPRIKLPPAEVQLYGLEMEAENVPDKFHGAPLGAEWNTVADGSLRNGGLEFVSKPLALSTIETGLRRFYNHYHAFHFESNERTSMHVHVDMRSRTGDEVLRILVAYCLVEPLIMAACGEWREENIYCVPFYRTNEDLPILRSALEPLTLVGVTRTCKYSAVYAEPLHRFGTLEFRQAPLWECFDDAFAWVKVVRDLAAVPELFATTSDLLTYYNTHGARGLAKHLFGGEYDWLVSKTSIDIDSACDALDVERQVDLLVSKKCGIAETDWNTGEDMVAPAPPVGARPTFHQPYGRPQPRRTNTTQWARQMAQITQAQIAQAAQIPVRPTTVRNYAELDINEMLQPLGGELFQIRTNTITGRTEVINVNNGNEEAV